MRNFITRVFREIKFRFSAQDIMLDSPTIQAQAKKFEGMKVSDHVYELLREENPDVEVVFVHGWQMKRSDPKYAVWRTWKMRESEECWPETLLPQVLNEENQGTPYRPSVYSIAYEARLAPGEDGNSTEISDDYLIVENLISELILLANVGQGNGVPVFLVGHDLGGILIKIFVMQVEKRAATCCDQENKTKLYTFLGNLKYVFFYATPQAGSKALEEITKTLDPENASQMLVLMKVLNKETARINKAFEEYRWSGSDRTRFSTYGMHALYSTDQGGFYVQVVEEASVRPGVDEFFSAQADHFTICQPVDRSTSELQILSRKIRDVITTMRKTTRSRR